MTISAEQNLVEYTGNGTTTAFPVPWRFLASGDLKVLLRVIATGVDTVQVEISAYTVSGVGNAAGGTVTFITAPATTEKVVIYGDPPLKQETDYTTADAFPAESHEAALDELTNQQKATRSRVVRALRIPFGDDASIDTELDSQVARASKFLSFDADGKPLLAAGTSANLGPVTAYMDSLLDDADADAARRTLLAAYRSYPIDDLSPNGDFMIWHARPASGSVQSPGGGVGFPTGAIADGWFGGPGPGSQYTFTNPVDDPATGARECMLDWDVSVSSGSAQHDVAGQITAGYWRGTFLEFTGRASPEHFAGKTVTIEFDAKASSVLTIAPIGWVSMGLSLWAASTTYFVGDVLLNDSPNGEYGGSRVYIVTTAGTSAGSGGPTGTGSGIADNTVVWDYVGEVKGREYELFEAGASPTTTQIAWGDPVASARCILSTSWQTFRRSMFIPELNEGSGAEYAGQADDNGSRTLAEWRSTGAYFGYGFDLWHNAATGPIIELRKVRVWVGDEVHTEKVRIPRDLALLQSNGWTRILNLFRPYASQSQMEAGTSLVTNVAPGTQHYHPSAAKFWLKWNTSGTTISASYNVTSVTNSGVGNESITIATDFSTANWAAAALANTSDSGDATKSVHPAMGSQTAGTLQLLLSNGADPEAFADATICCALGFGDQ